MKILACDTSDASCGCAVTNNSQVLGAAFLSVGLTHSQTFMPMLHELMQRVPLNYQDIDAFACTVGPGSFTGIRIGLSAVKAMAYAADKPVVPVSSLRALAYPLLSCNDALIVPMIDARNQRVFASAYYRGREVISEQAVHIQNWVEECDAWLASNAPEVSIKTCGNACHMYREGRNLLKERSAGSDGGDHVDFVSSFLTKQSTMTDIVEGYQYIAINPVSVAAIAQETMNMYIDSLKIDFRASALSKDNIGKSPFAPEAVVPSYLAKTSAERQREDRLRLGNHEE